MIHIRLLQVTNYVCFLTLFLIYKIIDVINLSKKISKISNKNIIPIFWLASEDHDFDEIKEFSLYENKYVWNKNI